MIQAVVNIKTKKLYLLTQFSATVLSQMMKSCRRRMQNGKSLQQPLCAMKSRCTYQISMSSIKRAGSMDSNQHRHASIKKKIMQHSATKTRCYLFVGFSLGSLSNPISTQTLVKKHNCMYKLLLENFNLITVT